MKTKEPDTNPDPITGAPGSHPVGTGLGAAGGGAAGAAIGMAGGPAGAAVGAVIGAVAGGLAGKGVAEAIDPTAEDAYWREHHSRQPYADTDTTYEDDYAPAYRLGYQGYMDRGSRYDEAEPDLQSRWDQVKGKSRLTWERAKNATRAGWNRVERAVPGDSDNDGR